MSALGRLACRMLDGHAPVTEAFDMWMFSQTHNRTVHIEFSFLVCRRCDAVLEEHSWVVDDDLLD